MTDLPSAKKRVTIVIADDDPDDCLLAREALEESCLANDVHVVHDGRDLLQYLRECVGEASSDVQTLPAIVLLDLNMPRMNGLEALQEIRADGALRHVPVVILTTSQSQEEVLRAYDAGANSYITKPVTFSGLVKVMKTLGHYWLEIVELPGRVESGR